MSSACWRRASHELSEFVTHAATTTSGLVGFAWTGRSDAPATYPDLIRAVERSLHSGEPLPVSSENTESVIYGCSEVNLALRFWHDVSHVLRGLDFTPSQELQLTQVQLGVLERAGWDRTSLTWRLLQADLVGQVYLSAIGRRFPCDQRAFVERCLTDSIAAAVLAELGDEAVAQRLALLPARLVA